MSMRRQRIKAPANLSLIKRKPRREELPTAKKEDEEEEAVVVEAEAESPPVASTPAAELELEADAIAFKMPASSAGQLEEVFHSDLEDNVIQMDLQKTTNGFPMSPSKAQARQRVRPTPVFGQRRNSFVGSPMASDYEGDYQSPATPTRRERYLSGSSSGTPLQQQVHSPMPPSPYKYLPPASPGMGRIRTESTCSTYSEGGSKQRKGDDRSQSQIGQRLNARRDFETRFNKGVPDKSTFKMMDMIFYNPENNPMVPKQSVTTIKDESGGDDSKPAVSQLLEPKGESTSAMLVPQLKLDANGEMIIDEKTLEIETTAEVEARKVLANSSLILMDETTGDNGFYKRHKRTPYWTSDETVRFYRSLQIIGTDFSLMCQMFPTRSRRDLKLKYKKEERTNGQLINKALLYPKAFNIQELKDQLEEEDREREENDRKWREIARALPGNPKKRSRVQQQSKASRALNDGDVVYENEHVTSTKLGKHAWAKRRKELETDENDGSAPAKRKPKAKRRSPKVSVPAATESLSDVAAIKQEKTIKTEQTSSHLPTGGELQAELNGLLMDDPVEYDVDVNKPRDKTIINMDDGTLSYVSDVEPAPETPNRKAETYLINFIEDQDHELITPDDPIPPSTTEPDIEQILAELAEGSLALVSSLDPEHEDRVLNEIYMLDKKTGELCETPLKIPEHIVQCIMNVMQPED
uniref:B double prime 1, isoform A n=1 Tax=Drosophila melanogaster TaxID=7227 RepID=Q9VJZ3_DROME|nr:B double prime 1, isoform A [Drosophila melanogaster]AAF53291.2 B double prime 1, isoform A [Drosophila melanogaster]ACX61599.1 FI12401p [Drosophila melanogaster]|eukprot:NP_609643.2 B double prime 1, isoform A [Drosophila melanogaster]